MEYCKSGKKPDDIPVNPQAFYRDSWIGYGDWLSTLATYRTSLNEIKHEPKQKLTLSLSKHIINQAKSTNLNISALTQNLLNTLTYDQIYGTKEQVIKSYEALLDAVIPVIRKYSARIEVGLQLTSWFRSNKESSTGYPIQLDDSGLSICHGDTARKIHVGDVFDHLYTPTKILENTILALIEASEKNKNKVKELLLALRLVRALFEENENTR
jgi:hypothetical protein